MIQLLGTSIFEVGWLVGSSLRTVIITHEKWINDIEISSTPPDIGRPRIIKEKERRRLSRLLKHIQC